jgi:hypothetical protein
MGSMVIRIVADGLLALGRDVEKSGGDEVGGFEYLEVALGGVVALGAVDDGLAGCIPSDFLLRGVDSGDGPDATVGKAEADPEGVLEGGGGGVEEEGEKVAALAKDAAQDLGDGEDELAVGDFVADGGGDPLADGAGAALVAGGAEMAALAGGGEEAFVSAVRALEAGEAGGEVTTTEEGLDGVDGVGVEWAEGLAVVFLVIGEEGLPAVVDDLPERRGTGATGLVDGRHKKCS